MGVALLVGDLNPELRRVFLGDVVALVALVAALALEHLAPQ